MRTIAVTLLFSAFCILPFMLESANATPRRVCIDNSKGVVVVRRRCKAPRFTEVTPDLLTEAQTLGGFEAGSYLRAGTVISDDFKKSLTFNGDISSNQVICPEGSVVTGGGVSIVENNGLRLRRSRPLSNLSGWNGGVEAVKNFASGTLFIYAICSEATPASDDS